MILGIGTDLVDVERVRRSVLRWGARWEMRVFSQDEIEYCRRFADPAPHYAGRFAAKEAVFKALPRQPRAFMPREIEIIETGAGRPEIKLSGRTQAAIEDYSPLKMHLSISHEKATAAAFAVVEKV